MWWEVKSEFAEFVRGFGFQGIRLLVFCCVETGESYEVWKWRAVTTSIRLTKRTK